jgi:hypothetical protein
MTAASGVPGTVSATVSSGTGLEVAVGSVVGVEVGGIGVLEGTGEAVGVGDAGTCVGSSRVSAGIWARPGADCGGPVYSLKLSVESGTNDMDIKPR